MLHRRSRYDLQGKEILKTQEKFYLADVALRHSVLGYNADSVATGLENILYPKLCRRVYPVNVGKTSDDEIHFAEATQNKKIGSDRTGNPFRKGRTTGVSSDFLLSSEY